MPAGDNAEHIGSGAQHRGSKYFPSAFITKSQEHMIRLECY